MIAGFPEAQMPQYFFYDLCVLDKTDYFHNAMAFWTKQRKSRARGRAGPKSPFSIPRLPTGSWLSCANGDQPKRI